MAVIGQRRANISEVVRERRPRSAVPQDAANVTPTLGGVPRINSAAFAAPGRALQGVGSALSGLAAKVQAQEEKAESFRAEIEYTKTLGADQEDLTRITDESEDGSNIAADMLMSSEQRWQAFREQIPERLRPEYDLKREKYKNRLSASAAATQYGAQKQFYTTAINSAGENYANLVATDPGQLDSALRGYEELVSKSPLRNADKQKMLQKGLAYIEKSQAEAIIQSGDPELMGRLKDDLSNKSVVASPKGQHQQIIFQAAKKHGVPTGVVLQIARIESGFNPNAKNPLSSARGYGQFINSTARKYGLRNDGTDAPAVQAAALAKFTRDNISGLRKGVGRDPTAGEIYLAHFLGLGGAAKAMRARPEASVASVMGGNVVKSNPFLKGKTIGDLVAWADRKMGGAGSVAVSGSYSNLAAAQRLSLLRKLQVTERNRQRKEVAEVKRLVTDDLTSLRTTGKPLDGFDPERASALGPDAQGRYARARQFAREAHELETDGTPEEAFAWAQNVQKPKPGQENYREQLTMYQDAMKVVETVKERDLAQRIVEPASGDMPMIDPSSNSNRKAVDNAVDQAGLRSGVADKNPRSVARVLDIIKRTKVIPQGVFSDMRAAYINGSPEQRQYAIDILSEMIEADPQAVDLMKGGKKVKSDVAYYQMMTGVIGLPPEKAFERLDMINSPEYQAKYLDRKKEALKIEIDEDDLTDMYDGWLSSAPELGGTDIRKMEIMRAYRELVTEHYAHTGDRKMAKEAAKKELMQSYSVSDITGTKRVMRYAPEKHYPVDPETGNIDYFRDELRTAVNHQVYGMAWETTEGIDIIESDRIFIQSSPATEQDVNRGQLPRYEVYYLDETNGVPQLKKLAGQFRADVPDKGRAESTTDIAKLKSHRQRRAAFETRRRELPKSGLTTYLGEGR